MGRFERRSSPKTRGQGLKTGVVEREKSIYFKNNSFFNNFNYLWPYFP